MLLLSILAYEQAENGDSDQTPLLSNAYLMEQVRHRGAKLTRGTISVLLGRLSKNNHIILKEHSKANNNGGSAYRVLKSGLNALMKSSLTKTPSDSLTKTTLVSKSVVNTTTTDKTLIEK